MTATMQPKKPRADQRRNGTIRKCCERCSGGFTVALHADGRRLGRRSACRPPRRAAAPVRRHADLLHMDQSVLPAVAKIIPAWLGCGSRRHRGRASFRACLHAPARKPGLRPAENQPQPQAAPTGCRLPSSAGATKIRRPSWENSRDGNRSDRSVTWREITRDWRPSQRCPFRRSQQPGH